MTIIYAAVYNGVSVIPVSTDTREKIKEDANRIITNSLRDGWPLSTIGDFAQIRLETLTKKLTKRHNGDDDLKNGWGKCWQFYKIEYLLHLETLCRLKLDKGGDIRWVSISLHGLD